MARLVAIGSLLVVLGAQVPAVPPPSVRFHHFHYRAGDPAAAMRAGALGLDATRVLLRGLGVGVRVGRAYALFDRSDGTATDRPAALDADAAYAAARNWLRAHGVDVALTDAASREGLSRTFASERLDHVAFTSIDTAGVIAALEAQGAGLMRRTGDSAWFQAGGAGIVEIVADLDRPDAFWCPMHPDVRAADPGTCPRCGMALVPIPPLRVGEYRMDVAVVPQPDRRGASKLRLTLLDPDRHAPVEQLAIVHERPLHLFIVDRGLQFFRHVHPEPAATAGVFELQEDLPPGEYVVIADFLPQAGRSQMLQRAIVTPGFRGPLFPAPPALAPDDPIEKQAGGIRVSLEASNLRAGKDALLRFTLTDAADGRPVTDLDAYLGAAGHVLIVNADLTIADHAHPDDPASRGPSITFQPLMPAAGLYKLWLQVQRDGRVVTIPFVLSVSGP